jgi:hypothetical protein
LVLRDVSPQRELVCSQRYRMAAPNDGFCLGANAPERHLGAALMLPASVVS